MNKSLLVVFRHAPYGRALARGGYDVALAAAAFDQPVKLLFMDDGVWQLLPGQQADRIEYKSIEKTLASLPLYDIDRLHVDETSLAARGLRAADLVDGVSLLNDSQVGELMTRHEQVLVF